MQMQIALWDLWKESDHLNLADELLRSFGGNPGEQSGTTKVSDCNFNFPLHHHLWCPYPQWFRTPVSEFSPLRTESALHLRPSDLNSKILTIGCMHHTMALWSCCTKFVKGKWPPKPCRWALVELRRQPWWAILNHKIERLQFQSPPSSSSLMSVSSMIQNSCCRIFPLTLKICSSLATVGS